YRDAVDGPVPGVARGRETPAEHRLPDTVGDVESQLFGAVGPGRVVVAGRVRVVVAQQGRLVPAVVELDGDGGDLSGPRAQMGVERQLRPVVAPDTHGLRGERGVELVRRVVAVGVLVGVGDRDDAVGTAEPMTHLIFGLDPEFARGERPAAPCFDAGTPHRRIDLYGLPGRCFMRVAGAVDVDAVEALAPQGGVVTARSVGGLSGRIGHDQRGGGECREAHDRYGETAEANHAREGTPRR